MLTTRTLADRLGVSTRTIEQMRADGTGPAYLHVGRQVRYPEQTVTDWESRNLTTTGDTK